MVKLLIPWISRLHGSTGEMLLAERGSGRRSLVMRRILSSGETLGGDP
jgi:hypothetical protein